MADGSGEVVLTNKNLPTSTSAEIEQNIAASSRLLPQAAKPALNRLAGLAAQLLDAQSAQVSLITDVQTVVGGAHLGPDVIGSVTSKDRSLCAIAASTDEPLVITDAKVDDRFSSLPDVVDGTIGSYLGVPLKSETGATVGELCVFDSRPHAWSDSDVALLQQLATSAIVELELSALSGEFEASRARWELAVDAGGIGTFDWNLATGKLTWDERLIELFGYDVEDFTQSIEAFNARVHPDDLDQVTRALRECIESCGELALEYRVVRPNNDTRSVQARGRAFCDDAGKAIRILGAAYDITPVRAGEARVARILESMSGAFYSLDRNWNFTYVNSEAEQVLKRSRNELLNGNIWELFPSTVDSEFELHYREAMESGQPITFEAFYPEPLNSWYEVRAWPAAEGLSVYFLNITERRATQLRAERNAQRATLLAEVGAELSATLEIGETLTRLSRLVVPTLADWCIVTLIDSDTPVSHWGQLRDVASWHANPDKRGLVRRYTEYRIDSLRNTSFLARTFETGQPTIVENDAAAKLRAVVTGDEANALVAELDPNCLVVLPLRAHGRTLGLLSLFGDKGSNLASADIFETSLEVASRAGLALDNARLYSQQRQLSEGLQRSLLTAPPEPDHMQIVVRYEPASDAAQVGGDWYDAFMQNDGATTLVIGDVVGHDTQAAAAMGQIRGLLRGIAATTGEGPAEVLTRLDSAMELLQVNTTATAVIARLEQTSDERSRGVTRLRWSNAGHPPPMAINADGTVLILSGISNLDADLLLGIDAKTKRTESEVALDRGATVLMYTDGLVEQRNQPLHEGLAKLRDTLQDLADCSLDDLCDGVLQRMLPDESEDDVALAAIRLHRQDQPRPPEAGPQKVPESLLEN